MTGSNPLVSVIIPAYNHEKYVQEAINSIIAQTYKNIELIIVDDGSKDSTWQKIQEIKGECEKRFVRVVFETKENEGTCKTLNQLLSLADGEYIYLIASDDMAKPYAIEKEVNFLSHNLDYALVVGDNEIIDSDGKRCYWDQDTNNIYDKTKAKYLTFGDQLKTWRDFDFTSEEFGMYHTLYVGNYIPNGYLFRKSIFDKTGLFTTEAPLEDWYMMLQISKYAKMKYLDEVLFSYRWHANNSIKNRELAGSNFIKTKEYEGCILQDEECLKSKGILSEMRCFLRMHKKIKELETHITTLQKQNNDLVSEHENLYLKMQVERADLQQKMHLLTGQNLIYFKHYKYKVLSALLFGKNKHFKERNKFYHEKIREIRKINKLYRKL